MKNLKWQVLLLAVVPLMFSWTSGGIKSVVDPQSAAPGTYQIIQDVKMREIFTVEVMDSLRVVFESMRNDSLEVIHAVSPYTKARIPSRQTIESSDFIPLSEYEYIEE